jgi:hypothetical protein
MPSKPEIAEWRNKVIDLMETALKATDNYTWVNVDLEGVITVDGQINLAGLEALAKILRDHPYQ